MACHQWISVTAKAGVAKAAAAVTAASCTNLIMDFTIKPLSNLQRPDTTGSHQIGRRPAVLVRNGPVWPTIDDHPGVSTIASSRLHCKKALNLFRRPIDSIIKGKKLSVYRADFPRTLALVVALLSMAAATSAFAREFRAADTQSEDYPTVQALRYMGRLDRGTQRRPAPDSCVSLASARRGKRNHRADPRRRDRPQSHQRGADRNFRTVDERAGNAVSVPIHRTSAEGAGRPDRQ